jgi:predicted  nucleic acid-binding Zn-ribbon protein
MANESKPGFHRHKCYECGYIWEHNDDCVYQPGAHNCPKCGVKETWKYFGDERPAHSEYCSVGDEVRIEADRRRSDSELWLNLLRLFLR